MSFTVTLPIRAVNTSNSRENWRTIAKRAKAHRTGVSMVLRSPKGIGRVLAQNTVAIVRLTRIAPRDLDDDGNVTSLKAVRDGVADALGLASDRDPRVTWHYAQGRGGVREYAVRIDVEIGVPFEVRPGIRPLGMGVLR